MAKCLKCGHYVNEHQKYCSTCRKNIDDNKNNSKIKEQKYSPNTQCCTCIYSWKEFGKENYYYCDYLNKMGHMRPCKPSPDCTEYKERVG